jgi:hypothetical protein
MVLVISGVLALIGVVSYAVLADNFADRDARANIDRVVLAQRAWALRNGAWTEDAGDLKTGRNLFVTQGPSTGAEDISMSVSGGVRLGLAALSTSGACQGKVLGDPLGDRSEAWVDMSGLPCTGQAALAAV